MVAVARRRPRVGGGGTGHAQRFLRHLLRLLAGLGVVNTLWVQGLLFPIFSVLYLVVFRGRLQARIQMPPPPNIDSLVGVLAIVQERLLPGVVGKVEVRGSMWSARNTSDVTLESGQRARVAAIDDGLTLAVVPE
jgi:inner membrane protein